MADFNLLGAGGAFKAKLLNLRHARQEVIAANVANADTPGYKAKRLDFESELAQAYPANGELAMARTDGQHLPIAPTNFEPMIQEVETAIPKGDGNSVDLEQEMARQTANQLLYNYAAQSLSGQISQMRMIIGGGR
ncbi:MAG: flagellar basal body rod protein FlgB [Magnetococcales bacterium]|nr:flagellar basal body rod protein FlgB [Magnetococcales bacterium]